MQLLVSDRPKYSKAGTVLILKNQYVHPGVLAPNGKFVLSNGLCTIELLSSREGTP